MSKEIFDFYDRTSLKSYNLDQNMQYQLNILGSLDVFTRKHCENVASIVCRICQYLHCSKSFTEYCTICAYLHDIGKQFIPASILQKQSALTKEEFEIMKNHTTIGYKICMDDLKLRPYSAGTLYHHEALNGSGYPNGLTKDDIPYEAQIIRVADEYDAIVSKRQYKSHINIVDTLNILIDETKPFNNSSKNQDFIQEDSSSSNIKIPNLGKNNPIIVKALIKVIIDDTEYEISCIMDYLKDLKVEIKRLEEIEKYNKKRLSSNNENKQNYYLEGMKCLLTGQETVENFEEILNTYRNIYKTKSEQIDKLFQEIKVMKKMKV